MKIAYILSMCTAVDGKSNGVRIQAETWAMQLKSLGHEVTFINPCGNYKWSDFDIVHFFGYGTWLYIAKQIKNKTNSKLVISPIIDTNRSVNLCRIVSNIKIPLLNLESPWSSLRNSRSQLSHYYVRSDHEYKYVKDGLGVSPSLITKIPLGYRNENTLFNKERENFCLHVSILSGHHKNVNRLIEAAIKYRFNLILAGSFGNDNFKKYILNICSQHHNIRALGFITDEELFELFSKAKVFALPSTFEGVGLVALEAAASGCEIVITDRGGPKEYYKNLARTVNPTSIDSIGKAITQAMNDSPKFQPELMNYIKSNFNKNTLGIKLEDSYKKVLSTP